MAWRGSCRWRPQRERPRHFHQCCRGRWSLLRQWLLNHWLLNQGLLNKRLLPKSLIWKLYASEALRSDPRPLVAFAQAANLVKMSAVVAELLRDGELSPLLLRRWLNPRSLVTM